MVASAVSAHTTEPPVPRSDTRSAGYSLLIFDFDGTLADTMGHFARVMDLLAERHGFERVDAAHLEALRGLGTRELMQQLGVPVWKLPAIVASVRREMARVIDEIRLFDGVPHLLRDLRRHGIRTAIVSSNSRANVEKVLGLKHASMIDHFGCGADLFGKQRKFRQTLKALEIEPALVLCIGDELRDADAAAAAGLDFSAVSWGFASEAVLAPRSRHPLFRDPTQILDAALGTLPPA